MQTHEGVIKWHSSCFKIVIFPNFARKDSKNSRFLGHFRKVIPINWKKKTKCEPYQFRYFNRNKKPKKRGLFWPCKKIHTNFPLLTSFCKLGWKSALWALKLRFFELCRKNCKNWKENVIFLSSQIRPGTAVIFSSEIFRYHVCSELNQCRSEVFREIIVLNQK